MKNFLLSIILLQFFFINSAASSENKARLSLGVGIYNFMKNGFSRCETAQGGCDPSSLGGVAPVEYKDDSLGYNIEYFGPKNFFKYIKPFVGFLGTSENAIYSYFGLSGDLFFLKCKCLVVTPSLAAGWYIDGDEIKLGHHIEFRSGGDITYKFKNNVRVGVGIFHISNASIGNSNPGSEQAIFKYQIPF